MPKPTPTEADVQKAKKVISVHSYDDSSLLLVDKIAQALAEARDEMREKAARCADDHCGGERIGAAIRSLK